MISVSLLCLTYIFFLFFFCNPLFFINNCRISLVTHSCSVCLLAFPRNYNVAYFPVSLRCVHILSVSTLFMWNFILLCFFVNFRLGLGWVRVDCTTSRSWLSPMPVSGYVFTDFMAFQNLLLEMKFTWFLTVISRLSCSDFKYIISSWQNCTSTSWWSFLSPISLPLSIYYR